MGDVTTQPVTATHYDSQLQMRLDKTPGSFHVGPPDEDGLQFTYCCPCGCGHVSWLNVGKHYKPEMHPSWNWNGSLDKPTLTPSVHHVGHWHGWLTDGVWKSC